MKIYENTAFRFKDEKWKSSEVVECELKSYLLHDHKETKLESHLV